MKKLTLLTLSVWLTAAAVRADERLDNWHQWRGPLATGMAPNADPPVTWDEKTNLKWKAPVPGRGASTPIVWGDQVFVLTALDTGRKSATPPKAPDARFEKRTKAPDTVHQFVVLSYDRATGKERWRQIATEQVPHEGHHQTHSYAAASPTTDGKYLFVSFGSRGLFCYDLAGKPQWETDLGDLQTRLGWGEAITPTLYRDTLFVAWDQEAGSFLTALDARTGKAKWKVDRDESSSWNTPLVVEHKGRTQVIVNATNRVRSYDPETGKVLWACGGQTVNPIPSPVAENGVVYCMSGYRGAAAAAISLDASGDVTGTDKVLWKYDRGTPYVPSPLLADGRLYFTQRNENQLTVLDTKTGKPVINQERLPGMTSLYASPAGAKDRVYFVGRDGTTLVLKRGDKLEVLATNRLDDEIDASPALVGRQMFLRGVRHLYCVEAK